MSRTIALIAGLFLSLSLAAQTPAEKLVQSDLEKTRSMTAEESFSYMRRTYTMRAMEVLARMLEAWRLKYGRYPEARSIDDLHKALSSMFDASIPTTDRWGTAFRYVSSREGRDYRIVSAGGDLTFDEASWSRRGDLATDDDDAVLAGGAFTRRWTDATKPGLGVRAKLNAEARRLLSKADAQLAADDREGALAAYISAVKADKRAADLESIRRYAPPLFAAPPPPPPPPPPKSSSTPAAAPPPPPAPEPPHGTPLHIAALRQFLEIHPADPDATRDLLFALPAADALTVADAYVAQRSSDPDAYEMRAIKRISAGRALDGLADYEKAASLDASNAERHYKVAVAAYGVATQTAMDASKAREQLRHSLALLDRAEALRPNYTEAMMYRSLVLRKLSELETDAAARKKLAAQADAARTRAMEALKSRSPKE